MKLAGKSKQKYDVLSTIKKEILSEITYEYERIILFGSRARNANRKESDYDILVILKNEVTEKEKITLSTQIRKRLADMLIDADIIVKTKSDLNYYKDKIGSVINSAVREGVVL